MVVIVVILGYTCRVMYNFTKLSNSLYLSHRQLGIYLAFLSFQEQKTLRAQFQFSPFWEVLLSVDLSLWLGCFSYGLFDLIGQRLLQIILSQEKSIRKLADLVRSLREQLLQCKHKFKAVNNTAVPLTELLNELEQQQILDV